MERIHDIKVVVLDADDTLWDCQGHFERVMQQLYTALSPWADRATAASELFATERKNMALLGFGCKAFTLSVLETAMRVSGNSVPVAVLNDLLRQCYDLLSFPTTPLAGVEPALQQLQKRGLRLVVFTKGELLDQQHKLQRSGLSHYFEHVEITSDKGLDEFRALHERLGVAPWEVVMVGNSLKSDIAPALAAGWWAVHVPFHVTWELEHAEAIEHPRLRQINEMSELPPLLG